MVSSLLMLKGPKALRHEAFWKESTAKRNVWRQLLEFLPSDHSPPPMRLAVSRGDPLLVLAALCILFGRRYCIRQSAFKNCSVWSMVPFNQKVSLPLPFSTTIVVLLIGSLRMHLHLWKGTRMRCGSSRFQMMENILVIIQYFVTNRFLVIIVVILQLQVLQINR